MDILNHKSKQHKEVLEMQNKQFEEIKKNKQTQNDQSKQMIGLFSKLVNNISKKKKKRLRTDSYSD